MDWQADPTPGRATRPARATACLSCSPASSTAGPWAAAAPSAALAVALEAAAGPEDLYEGADTDALVGIVRQWAAIESWAAAGMLAALRAMMREDGEGTPLLRRRSDLPDGWDDSLTYEIAGALAMGPVSAGNLAGLAWTLGTRLPGIGRLLADGTLTRPKAKLIVAGLRAPGRGRGGPGRGADPGRAGREDLLPGGAAGLAGRPGGGPGRGGAAPVAAEQERARVTVFREESGTVGLSGRDLPGRRGAVRARQRAGPRRASTRRPARSPARPPAACRRWPTSTCSTGSPPRTGSRSPAPRAAEPPAIGRPNRTARSSRRRSGRRQSRPDDDPSHDGPDRRRSAAT